MKLLCTLAFYLLILAASAQPIDSCGLDSKPELTTTEANFLNSHYMYGKEGFDFAGKKIAFVTGSAGTTIITKAQYFYKLKNSSITDTINGSGLIIFTAEEKIKSGGYDAVITYWVKAIFNGQKWLANRLSTGYKPKMKYGRIRR